MSQYKILQGDCRNTLAQLADKSVQTCVTSPPYFGLRDYGMDDQIGLEQTPKQFVDELVAVFREVKRVLKDDGTLWVNIGDSYHGGGSTTKKGQDTRNYESKSTLQSKHTDGSCDRLPKPRGYEGFRAKDLIGIPWRLAFALQDDGWYLRQDIIWHKPNPMPESVTDRCVKSHEYIFLLSKSPKYYFNHEAIKEKSVSGQRHQAPRISDERKELRSDVESRHRSSIAGGQSMQAEPNGLRNKRSVWTVTTKPYKEAHFATFPPELIRPCILAGSRPSDLVLDPFSGSGTTGLVSIQQMRDYVGCELNPDYIALTNQRLRAVQPVLQFM